MIIVILLLKICLKNWVRKFSKLTIVILKHTSIKLVIMSKEGRKIPHLLTKEELEEKLNRLNELHNKYGTDDSFEFTNRHKIFVIEEDHFRHPEYLVKRPQIGIDACNVAPEFGVIETKTIMTYFKRYEEYKLLDKFIELAIASKKWLKWVINGWSDGLKAEMCGHYIRGLPEVIRMIAYFEQKYNIDLNRIIRFNIKQAMDKYCYYLWGKG